MIRNFSGSGPESHSLVPTSINKHPPLTADTADEAGDNPSPKKGRPDVVPPKRPAPPTKPVASHPEPSSVRIP